jgi:dihydroneopterin aldolase/2-amino-4-hydroxy-6-hydroxymethyldihydropteridine diphosphokinase/dihydropteroate synthase
MRLPVPWLAFSTPALVLRERVGAFAVLQAVAGSRLVICDASRRHVRNFGGTPRNNVFVSMGSGGAGQHGSERTPDRVMMKEQSVQCVIGCNPDERVRTQELLISVAVWVDLRESLSKHVKHCDLLDVQKTRMDAPDWATHAAAELAGTHNYSTLAKIARKTAEEGKYFTIEALAEAVARDIVLACNVPRITVLIDKPEALRKKGARAASVEITRHREDFFFQGRKPISLPDLHPLPQPHGATPDHSPATSTTFSSAASAQLAAELSAACEPFQRFRHVAYIALGSNVGERAANIQQALKLLCGTERKAEEPPPANGKLPYPPVQLLGTSFLYESPASYVTAQPNFINAACKVATNLEPLDLLALLKQVLSPNP